jgi:hypothetical protein
MLPTGALSGAAFAVTSKAIDSAASCASCECCRFQYSLVKISAIYGH